MSLYSGSSVGILRMGLELDISRIRRSNGSHFTMAGVLDVAESMYAMLSGIGVEQ
jgi:hypothetical protein